MAGTHQSTDILDSVLICVWLTRILHEGFGFYGQTGKAGWTIARGQICLKQICMSEASPKGQGQDALSIHSHSYGSRGIVQDATPACS